MIVIESVNNHVNVSAYCSNVEMIFAKVPIVKFFDNISHCDVDINVNNIVGIKNSFLLRSISLGELVLLKGLKYFTMIFKHNYTGQDNYIKLEVP